MVTARKSLLWWCSVFLLLVGACAPASSPTPEPLTSQIALATLSLMPSPTAIPLPYPGYQSPTPSITPTITPVGYPPPTQLPLSTLPPPPTETPTLAPTITRTPPPTIDPAALSPAGAAALLPWTEVAAEPRHRLYQVSRSPYGVEGLEWSPDGRYLWIQVATSGYLLMGGQPTTVPLIAGPRDRSVWTTNGEGDSLCNRRHEWSPDGRALVFYRDGRLWQADADGSNARSLPIAGGFPRFSPDGRSIALGAYRTDGRTAYYDLWVQDADGASARRLIQDAGRGQFAWSPGGEALAHLGSALETFPGRARLWIADQLGGKPIFVDTGELPGTEGCLGAPVWILDGQKILVTEAFKRRIWLVDRTGEVEIIGDSVESRAGPWLYPVSVSPDGYYLVYDDPRNNKVVLELRSETAIRLDRGGTVAWSPAAPRFVLWSPYGSEAGAPPIDLVDATDGGLRQLVPHGLWPAWSPDGRRVAYWRPEPDGYSLWLVSVDSGEEIRLTPPVGQNPRNLLGGPLVPFNYDSTPQWSSDGRFVAFMALRDGLPEAHVVDLAPGG